MNYTTLRKKQFTSILILTIFPFSQKEEERFSFQAMGLWNCCNINTYFPVADSDFHIPERFTSGKGIINIEIRTEGIYTDFDYTVLS